MPKYFQPYRRDLSLKYYKKIAVDVISLEKCVRWEFKNIALHRHSFCGRRGITNNKELWVRCFDL